MVLFKLKISPYREVAAMEMLQTIVGTVLLVGGLLFAIFGHMVLPYAKGHSTAARAQRGRLVLFQMLGAIVVVLLGGYLTPGVG